MNFPDLLSMDNDDESSVSPTPDDFSLSTYKENPLADINQTKMNENSKILFLTKCFLCQKIHENSMFTCSTCLNAGEFCSSKHNLCSKKQRDRLLSMLNKDDYQAFQDYSDEKSMHLQCSDRMFLLEKFNSEKTILRLELERKLQSSIKIRLMSQEIQLRKNRFHFIRYSIEKFREQLEQKKKLNMKIQKHIDEINARKPIIKKNIHKTKGYIKASNDKAQEKIKERAQADDKLLKIRQQRLKELMVNLFPVRHILAAEGPQAAITKALEEAKKSIDDEQIETDDEPVVLDERYEIVNSFLPPNGNYQIENLASIYNGEISRDSDSFQVSPSCDSPQLSPSRDSYNTLSALSHACQLINIIAFYLNIKLPFHLHQWNFNQDEVKIDHLRADIAKLNTNIISSCLSQGIQIEFTNAPYTLANLLKLLTFNEYPSRPKDVSYPQEYIDILQREVVDVNRAITTSYWFDDDDNNDYDKVITDGMDDEIVIISPNEVILDGSMTIREHINSSTSLSGHQQSSLTSGHQQPSVMSDSGFLSTIRNYFS